ncbi:hypothetical protein HK103_000399 [Boothiomyces macroporosus]|uniref:Ankyrin repeat protein n=1 Tax=Boothiomyces macroporosus TaxID=261099 RepID=A0AAD5Y5M2_9FUNG|nr:hypothetical protein HK103_000399 [Boothiomyces macroporosus]
MESLHELEIDPEIWPSSMLASERQGLINYILYFADYIRGSRNYEKIERILSTLNLEFDQFERILSNCQRLGLYKPYSYFECKNSRKLEKEIEQYEVQKFFKNLTPHNSETDAEILKLINFAVQRNSIVQVQMFLPFVDRKNLVNIKYLEQQLQVAAAKGKCDIFRSILRFSRDIDPTLEKCFALRIACTKGYTRIVELLLNDQRCDPSVQNNECIRKAATMGYFEIVQMLLLDHRVDATAKHNEALRFATLGGHFQVVESLTEHLKANCSSVQYSF